MVRIDLMADRIFRLGRRSFMAGLGAAALGPAMPGIAAGTGRQRLLLQARAGAFELRQGQSTPIWALQGETVDSGLRFRRGDTLEIGFQNDLPVAAVLNWHGLDGVAAAEPLLARPPLAAA